MRLIKAYTAALDEIPSLVLELSEGGPAVVDVYGKRTLVDAGVVVLFALDESRPLEGFEAVKVDPDPASVVEILAVPNSAGTRDPLVLDLTLEFLRSTDDLKFRPGIQVYLRTDL